MTQSIDELGAELRRAAGWAVAPDWNRLAHHVLAREAKVRQEALRCAVFEETKAAIHTLDMAQGGTFESMRETLDAFVRARREPNMAPLRPEVLAERLSH